MANKNLEIVINADDNASRKLKTFNDNLQKTSKRFSNFKKNISANAWRIAAWIGATFVWWWYIASKFINTAEKASYVSIGLKSQIEKLWNSSDITKWKISKLAEEFSKQSWQTETTIEKMAQLAMVYWVTSTKEIKGLIDKSLRLTAVTEWNDATSQTYIDTLRELAEWFKDPAWIVESLATKWVVFNEVFKDSIRKLQDAWKEWLAYDAIMWRIDKKIGWLNEVIPDITREQGKLNNSWEKMSEKIWKNLVPVLWDLIDATKPMVDDFSDWLSDIDDAPWKIQRISDWIVGLVGVLWWLSEMLLKSAEGWGMFFNQVGKIPKMTEQFTTSSKDLAEKGWGGLFGWIKSMTAITAWTIWGMVSAPFNDKSLVESVGAWIGGWNEMLWTNLMKWQQTNNININVNQQPWESIEEVRERMWEEAEGFLIRQKELLNSWIR